MRMNAFLALAVLVAALPCFSIRAADPSSIVEGEVEAATELVFTEGPAYHQDGSVFFTEIANNRIMRLNPGAAAADVFCGRAVAPTV